MRNLLAISCLALGCLIFVASVQAGWVAQTSGVSVTLYDIYFADANNGWCVGYGGTVLHTTNGGTTWLPQDGRTSTTASHEGVSAASPTTAWFVGNYQTPPDSDIIRKTTDGGTTWFPCTSGVHNPAGVGWSGVHFIDQNNGWICSGGPVWQGVSQVILHTTDGGNTFSISLWENYNGGLSRVFFKDLRHGWAVGGTEDSPATRGYAIRSTDGGNSWSESRRWGATTFMTYPLYAGVHFTDSLRGWICGTLFGAGRTGEITRRVDRTTDGGLTWATQWSERAPLQNDFWDIYFVEALNGWVVGTDIRRTTDGGTTWTVDTSGTPDLLAVHFVDVNNGWACGDGGTILKYTGISGVAEDQGPVKVREVALKAFPNPFSSYAVVPGHEQECFALYDISGRKVGTYRGDRIGEELSPGVYFLVPKDRDTKPIRVVKIR